jgi:hypothetical protein
MHPFWWQWTLKDSSRVVSDIEQPFHCQLKGIIQQFVGNYVAIASDLKQKYTVIDDVNSEHSAWSNPNSTSYIREEFGVFILRNYPGLGRDSILDLNQERRKM